MDLFLPQTASRRPLLLVGRMLTWHRGGTGAKSLPGTLVQELHASSPNPRPGGPGATWARASWRQRHLASRAPGHCVSSSAPPVPQQGGGRHFLHSRDRPRGRPGQRKWPWRQRGSGDHAGSCRSGCLDPALAQLAQREPSPGAEARLAHRSASCRGAAGGPAAGRIRAGRASRTPCPGWSTPAFLPPAPQVIGILGSSECLAVPGRSQRGRS